MYSKRRLQALMQPSSKASKWSQWMKVLPHLCQLSMKWTLKRLRYAGSGMQRDEGIWNSLQGTEYLLQNTILLSSKELPGWKIQLLLSSFWGGTHCKVISSLSGDSLISHCGSLWTWGSFCEWPNHSDETDFFMWSNSLPQHRYYQMVSSSCIFFGEQRCSIWPLVCQREKAGWEVSFESFLGNAFWPWNLSPGTAHISGLCSSPSQQGGAPS